MSPERFAVTLQPGARCRSQPTGQKGERVAGVRFRAWQPPRCLHPHIGVDAPLTFDLVDTWSGLSLGGCAYHVSHPGGRAHDTRPINAREAEGRLSARFTRLADTGGKVEIVAAIPTEDFPFTLDLRRG